MKKSDRVAASAIANSGNGGTLVENQPSNGHSSAETQPDLVAILASLQTLRDGDFSVRLPGSWVGLAGKIADTFNDIAAADQQMALELKRRWTSGRQRGKDPGTRAISRVQGSMGRHGVFREHSGRGSASADDGSDARDLQPWRRETSHKQCAWKLTDGRSKESSFVPRRSSIR